MTRITSWALDRTAADVRYAPITSVSVHHPAFAVTGDGVADDTTGIQAAAASAVAAGVPLVFPEAGRIYNVTSLNLDDTHGLRIMGPSGPALDRLPIIRRTTSGTDALISARRAVGLTMAGVRLQNTNAGFTGLLLDLRGDTGIDSRDHTFERVVFGGDAGARATALGTDLDGSFGIDFRHCLWQWCDVGVRGVRAGGLGYANGIKFDACHFLAQSGYSTKNAGTAWTFDTCIFSERIGALAGAYGQSDSGAATPQGVLFDGCWFGDVGSSASAQIEVNGHGFEIIGGRLGIGPGKGVQFVVNDTRGFVLLGTRITGTGSSIAVDYAATTGHARHVLLAHSVAGVPTEINGTPPTGSLYADNLGLHARQLLVNGPSSGDWVTMYDAAGLKRFAVMAAGELAWWNGAGADDTGTHILRQGTGYLRATGKFEAVAGLVTNTGTTAARPASPTAGQMYFDTTLGKPVWWNGSAWKDATGATV